LIEHGHSGSDDHAPKRKARKLDKSDDYLLRDASSSDFSGKDKEEADHDGHAHDHKKKKKDKHDHEADHEHGEEDHAHQHAEKKNKKVTCVCVYFLLFVGFCLFVCLFLFSLMKGW
jgi:molybdenum cofactor biosynthesis protein B